MLIDTRKVTDSSTVDADLCVIGAGAAGITIAREMEKRGISTVVLESGGLTPDRATGDMLRGENVGIPYEFAGGCRSRYLGGSSNCWGGWCRPWDNWDFDRRDWVDDSGWPFGKEELTSYYDRAHTVLKLGPNLYDPDHWVKAEGNPHLKRIVLDPNKIVDQISQFSPPVRFGIDYRDELKAARHVRVYYYANVVDIETDNPARNVRQVKVRTLGGVNMTVRAKRFVLATGGIENARVLLNANSVQPSGLGNGHDLVGRYYMDHPRLNFGSIEFTEAYKQNMLYDIKFHYQNDSVAAHGKRISAQFGLSEKVQREEGLLNARAWFRSIFPGETTEAVNALFRMKRRLSRMDVSGHTFGEDLAEMMRHPWDTTLFAAARVFHLTSLIRDVRFELIVEPQPNRDSRVMLSDQRDALGLRRVKVDWRLGPLVRRTFDRTVELLAQEMVAKGIAKVRLDDLLKDGPWPSSLEGTWHHMGSTRMHDSPRQGVVDRNCKIHDLNNMYVAGSSVFPTCGANYPTITLVSLALRLSDHLANQAAKPDAQAQLDAAVA